MIWRAIATPLYLLAAIPILGALFILGRINSSPRPRRSRRYSSIGAMLPPRRRRQYVVFGWAL